MTRSAQPALKPSIMRDEERQYRRIYRLSFLLFLLIAIIARLLPHRWRPASKGAAARSSILSEARETAHATLGVAFMH